SHVRLLICFSRLRCGWLNNDVQAASGADNGCRSLGRGGWLDGGGWRRLIEAERCFGRIGLAAAGLIGHSAGLMLHQIDIESFDADALLGQAVAERWEVVENREAGRICL